MQSKLIKMNIFLTGSFKIRVESIEILQITSSLRERISVMPPTFFMSRHPMTIWFAPENAPAIRSPLT